MPSALPYEERGSGDPVLLLHGFMQTRRSWDSLLARLGPGHRYLVADLPGHGAAGDRDPNWPAAVAAALAVLDAAGAERAHVAGYSLGGRLALAMAAAAPGRLLSLATIGAHAGFDQPERGLRLAADLELAGRIEREGIEWFAGYWAGLPLFAGLAALGEARNRELADMRRSLDARGVAASLRGMGAGATEPFWDRLAEVRVPALFMAGEHDVRYLALTARLAAAMPGGRAVEVAGAGHPAHLEQPDRVAELLRGHWRQGR